MTNLVGFLGALLLVISWVFETRKTFKSKNIEAIDMKFLLLNIFGGLFLFYHSFLIEDMVFVFLNTALLSLVIGELVIILYKKIKA